MFCCISAAENGGESPIVFNRELLQNLDKSVVKEITKRRVRYYRNLPHEKNSNYLTWQATFETKTKEVKYQCAFDTDITVYQCI